MRGPCRARSEPHSSPPRRRPAAAGVAGRAGRDAGRAGRIGDHGERAERPDQGRSAGRPRSATRRILHGRLGVVEAELARPGEEEGAAKAVGVQARRLATSELNQTHPGAISTKGTAIAAPTRRTRRARRARPGPPFVRRQTCAQSSGCSRRDRRPSSPAVGASARARSRPAAIRPRSAAISSNVGQDEVGTAFTASVAKRAGTSAAAGERRATAAGRSRRAGRASGRARAIVAAPQNAISSLKRAKNEKEPLDPAGARKTGKRSRRVLDEEVAVGELCRSLIRSAKLR